jgi:agmatinase
VAAAGDVAGNPFSIAEAMAHIQAATTLLGQVDYLVSLGGDHTIALPLLRAVHQHGGTRCAGAL